MGSSLSRAALRAALVATILASGLALSAGMVRILPWLLDPSVTWRIATPFARSLGVLALEAALAVGWPLGWALATLGYAERGEARVLALLGERPARTVARLGPQGLVLALLLGALAWASAKESTEPGRIVSELIADGRGACGRATTPRTYTVPFLGATWLCDPAVGPRLAGEGPGPLAALVFTARDARASGDLGTLELDDARVTLAHPRASLRVDALRLHGAAPWGHGSTVAPLSRAVALATAVLVSALAVVAVLLVQRARGRLVAIAIGAAGPTTALGLLRVAERLPAGDGAHVAAVLGAVPLLALAAVVAVAWTGARLPTLWHAAST